MSRPLVQLAPETVQRWRTFWSSDLSKARMDAIWLIVALGGFDSELRRVRSDLAECNDDVAALRKRIEERAAQQAECSRELQQALRNYDTITRETDTCLELVEQLLAQTSDDVKTHRERIDSAELRFAGVTERRPKLQEASRGTTKTSRD